MKFFSNKSTPFLRAIGLLIRQTNRKILIIEGRVYLGGSLQPLNTLRRDVLKEISLTLNPLEDLKRLKRDFLL